MFLYVATFQCSSAVSSQCCAYGLVAVEQHGLAQSSVPVLWPQEWLAKSPGCHYGATKTIGDGPLPFEK